MHRMSDVIPLVPTIVSLFDSHAWIPLAALLVGLLVRLSKSDVPIPGWNIPAKYRPALALGLGMVGGVLDAIVAGKPWKVAVAEGLFAASLAILGHTIGIEALRGGREIGGPPKDPPAGGGSGGGKVVVKFDVVGVDHEDDPTGPHERPDVGARRVFVGMFGIFAVMYATVLVTACTKPQARFAIHAAEVACENVAVSTLDGAALAVCIAFDELRPLLDRILEARAAGTPLRVDLVGIDGSRREIVVPVDRLPAAEAAVLEARARVGARK